MNKFMKYRAAGFTMMELMIVIVIVAVLLTLAYPSYVQYARKAKRGEAQQLLMNWAVNQEIWRSNHATYAPNSAAPNGIPAPGSDNYDFDFAVAPSASAYTLRATATGDQLNDQAKDDTPCTPLTLDQNGQKLPAVCWD
jgi:type IV pilus assembly protein PilE